MAVLVLSMVARGLLPHGMGTTPTRQFLEIRSGMAEVTKVNE